EEELEKHCTQLFFSTPGPFLTPDLSIRRLLTRDSFTPIRGMLRWEIDFFQSLVPLPLNNNSVFCNCAL
uniref:Uncharacterized protein n=1 Tax=Scophthalmus maximus TaxID=52904 RepID=A0A8D3DKN1_SCOMX